MRKITLLLSFAMALFIFASCGGKDKVETLPAPEIDATIQVELGHSANMNQVALSPDGKTLASSAYDGRLIIWDYTTKHQLKDFWPESQDNIYNYSSLLYTSDGKQLIAGKTNGEVVIYNTENWTVIKSIKIDGFGGKTLALSADNKFIAADASENIIKVIDLSSGSEVATMTGHKRTINGLAFSPDGKTLVSGAVDSTAYIWNATTGEIIKKIEAGEEVNDVAINDSKFAFAVDDIDKVFIWDYTKLKETKVISDISVDKLVFSGESLYMKQYSKIILYDLATDQTIKSVEDYGWDLSIVNNILATTGSYGITVYNIDSESEIAEFGKDTRIVKDIKVSPSGKFIVTANSHKSGSGGPDILCYSVDTAYKFSAYGTSGSDFGLFDFVGKTDVIFTEELYGDSYFYDLTTATSTSKIEDKVTNPFCFTSDGSLLIAQDYNNSDHYGIFDPKTGELKLDLVKSSAYLSFCGITPDDKYFVLLTNDFLKVFELPSGKEVKEYDRNDFGSIVFLDMMADGRYVIGEEDYDEFKIHDLMTGEIIFLVEDVKHETATLNPDKNTVALGCYDWTIKVFDIAQNTQTQTLKGHNAYIQSLEYTPDGKYLISSANDNQMKIWDLSGNLLLTVIGLEKLSDYDGETKDFVVFAPNGRYDGTDAGIEQFLYFDKNGQRLPASTYKDQCYTPNLLGRTLGQNFIETTTAK